MAGKRQHFIPRFLEKGFASHQIDDEIFTWAYRNGIKPFNANIKNIGVEGFFYSENNDCSLDDAITTEEYRFAEIVELFRANNVVSDMNIDILLDLLAHLEVRTRHLRQNLLFTSDYLLSEIVERLKDPVFCEIFIKKMLRKNPDLIKGMILKEFEKYGISREALPFFMSLMDDYIESQMSDIVEGAFFILEYIKKQLPKVLKDAVKKGHIQALQKGLSPEIKIKRLRGLRYNIASFKNKAVPLGDSVVLFHVEGNRSFKSFLDQKDELVAILLPISSSKVIVGSVENYNLDLIELRNIIASCSLEYFIASENTIENEALSKKISENAFFLSDFEMEKLIDSAINEMIL